MVKDGKKYDITNRGAAKETNWFLWPVDNKEEGITVELGNLDLHNACSYYVNKDPKQYPLAWFARKKNKTTTTHMSIPDKPESCPEGWFVWQQFDTPLECLLDYAKFIQDDHKDLSDDKININPPFIGRKRSARWQDERRRRGLIN